MAPLTARYLLAVINKYWCTMLPLKTEKAETNQKSNRVQKAFVLKTSGAF